MLSQDGKQQYFENTFYSNKKIFEENKDLIKKYDAIFIDEIQDYKRAWMEIIKDYYLADDGEYVLFGDVKQNIYNNKVEGKDVSTNVKGVISLTSCFRSDTKIKDLAIEFQQKIFRDKYEIDNFNNYSPELDLVSKRSGYVNYIYLQDVDNVSALYNIIHGNIINKNYIPNDITILCPSINLLKKFDAHYRYLSNEKTNTMFETSETMYNILFNRLHKSNLKILKDAIKLIRRDNDYENSKSHNELSILFTVYDLTINNPEKFDNIFNWYCQKFRTTAIAFKNLISSNQEEYKNLKISLRSLEKNIITKTIRDNKKLHFHMNRGTIKLSTIHSFKGWESESLFLVIKKKFANFQETFDEILYTGLTRSRQNLILINFGNESYHNTLKELVSSINS